MLSESDICIAILNWNGRHHLQEFLPSVIRNSGAARIRVIDNASTDDSVLWLSSNYPEIEIDVLDQNYGFTGGYNRGISKISSDLIILLNSDVEVRENWLVPLLGEMNADPFLAACQPKILSLKEPGYFEYAGAAGGFLDVFGYPFCRGRIFEHCEKDEGQYQTSIPVFWASGACMMVRRTTYLEAGGLEELFFAHMEEIDLCWRFWHMGWRVKAIPSSEVLHLGAGTLSKENPRKTYLNFRNGLAMLFINTFGWKTAGIILIRLMLDGIAGMQFLLKGKPESCRAIVQAHFAFYGKIGYWRKKRDVNKSMKLQEIPQDILLSGSIVWQFFLKGRKQFRDLGF